MRGEAALALVLVVMAAPAVAAEATRTVEVGQGGEPGIQVLVNGVDVVAAGTPRSALTVDPDAPAAIHFQLAPPENVTWEIRSIEVGLTVAGKRALSQASEWNSSIPPGFTVYVNDSLPVAQVKDVGTGLFRMHVAVRDAEGHDLYRVPFFVKVAGNPVLTASGAFVTVATVATAYGLWRLAQDVKEFYEAHKRHKKREAQRRARLEFALVRTALDVHRDAERIEKRGPIAWSATGLGLGAVTLSWLQFLGYLVFDLQSTLIGAMGIAAGFLTAALLLTAGWRRLMAKRVVSIPVLGDASPAPVGEAAPEATHAEAPLAPVER